MIRRINSVINPAPFHVVLNPVERTDLLDPVARPRGFGERCGIKRDWLALVVALMIGCIYASHHFFIPHFLAPEQGRYNPLPRGEYGDETLLYGPRSHAAFEDFRIRGDFSLAEYPTSPSLLPILNPLLLGGLGKLFGSFDAGVIASDFLFPSLIFFILYQLTCEIGVGRAASLFFSVIFLIAPKFGISLPPVSHAHFATLTQALFPYLTKSDVLFFSQFDEPKLTFLFLALSVYAIIRALKRRGGYDTIFAGVSFGILFYTYLYDWATMLASLGLMMLFFIWQKDYRRLKQVAVIVGIGFLASAYYWINLFRLAHIAQHKDVIARLGGEFSHHLRLATVWKSYARAAVLVLLLWRFGRGKAYEAVIVLGAMLLSYVVAVNEQVITGFNVQPDHWYRVQFLPVGISVFLLVYWMWGQYAPARMKRYASLVWGVLIVFMLAAFFAGQYAYSREHAVAFAMPDAYRQSFEWIEKHTDHDAVIGAFSINSNLALQLHASRKIFMPFALSTIAMDNELWKRAMIMAALWSVQPDAFAARIGQGDGANYFFGDEYGDHAFDANFFTYHWQVPETLLAEKTREYAEVLRSKKPLVIPYRLDYLFVDKQEFPSWKKPQHVFISFTSVFENERVIILRVAVLPGA